MRHHDEHDQDGKGNKRWWKESAKKSLNNNKKNNTRRRLTTKERKGDQKMMMIQERREEKSLWFKDCKNGIYKLIVRKAYTNWLQEWHIQTDQLWSSRGFLQVCCIDPSWVQENGEGVLLHCLPVRHASFLQGLIESKEIESRSQSIRRPWMRQWRQWFGSLVLLAQVCIEHMEQSWQSWDSPLPTLRRRGHREE